MPDVNETTEGFIRRISDEIGWRYLKSRCLKIQLDDLRFEVQFHSSKWNSSGGGEESIRINASFFLWSKKYGKACNINTVVADMEYENGGDYWYDISFPKQSEKAYRLLCGEIRDTAVKLYEMFKEDKAAAAEWLLKEPQFKLFNVRLGFIADELEIDSVREKCREIYSSYSDELKSEIELYRRDKTAVRSTWALNPSNERFIADNYGRVF